MSALVDRELETDRRFFRANPDAEFRVRLTGPAEIAEVEARTGQPMAVPEGCKIYTLVRAPHPTVRFRHWLWAEPSRAAALSEEDMADLWSLTRGPHSPNLRAEVRALLSSEA
ncbi:hypothetical protein ATO13_08251 [Stappia sp. 22II-S9-Z10]|nr:hypothetical protein ATO13_08251 [Stappia sp. 22II-S9-Z10]